MSAMCSEAKAGLYCARLLALEKHLARAEAVANACLAMNKIDPIRKPEQSAAAWDKHRKALLVWSETKEERDEHSSH